MSTETGVQAVEAKESPQLLPIVRCPICVDVAIDPVTTECGHSLCRACLANMPTQQGRTCPSGCGATIARTAYPTSVMLRNLMDAIPEVAAATKTRLAEIESLATAMQIVEPVRRSICDRQRAATVSILTFMQTVATGILLFLFIFNFLGPTPSEVRWLMSWPEEVATYGDPAGAPPAGDTEALRPDAPSLPYHPDCFARPNPELSNNVSAWGHIGPDQYQYGGTIMLCHERMTVLIAWSTAMIELYGWDGAERNVVESVYVDWPNDPLHTRWLSAAGGYTVAHGSAGPLCAVITDGNQWGRYRRGVELWLNASWAFERVLARFKTHWPLPFHVDPWTHNETRDFCHCIGVCNADIAALARG